MFTRIAQGVYLLQNALRVSPGALQELQSVVQKTIVSHKARVNLKEDEHVAPTKRCKRRGHLRFDLQSDEHINEQQHGNLLASMDRIDAVVKCDVLHHVAGGSLVRGSIRTLAAFAGSKGQEWHSDVEPLFRGLSNGTPPFYATIMIASDDVTPDMGPTEFRVERISKKASKLPQVINGVHRTCDITHETVIAPVLNKGDALVFDGLAVHRGSQATIDRVPMLYYTLHAPWYHDVNLHDGPMSEPIARRQFREPVA